MEQILDYLSLAIGSIGGLIIVYGIALGTVDLIIAELGQFRVKRDTAAALEKIRYDIGFHLLLGLEFLIAADIIRTILRPTLEELAILGGIVAIRTVISYFLGREIGQKPLKKSGE